MSERIGAGILGHLKYGAVVRSLLSLQSLTSQLLLDSMNEISCRLSPKLGRGGSLLHQTVTSGIHWMGRQCLS